MMSNASDLPPADYPPVEEAMFERAECRGSGVKIFANNCR